jgi:hypothetical protein
MTAVKAGPEVSGRSPREERSEMVNIAIFKVMAGSTGSDKIFTINIQRHPFPATGFIELNGIKVIGNDEEIVLETSLRPQAML